MNNLTELIEAIIFSAGDSISYEEIMSFLPDLTENMLMKSLKEIKDRFSGDSGILLLTFNKKVQFSSNPMYGDIIAEVLTPLKERSLSKSLMEVLSIIAYKEPVTRLEIEEIRGVNSEYAVSMLSKMNLIAVIGRKDSVGRPSLFATTDEFLKKFQLESLKDLPEFDTIMERIKLIREGYNEVTDNLYSNREIADTFPEDFAENEVAADKIEE